ncbi:uncharacterized protein LOC108112717 [Drosophila eugracilis]|uniref:uncharacterized protein LOC108112717 n=1 Tax=Drosophila eugracilis TaxID=29029 RepID=UPI0007E8025D|nr:uncharacterized protein LOC108112717 [Drosophila eugracilis]
MACPKSILSVLLMAFFINNIVTAEGSDEDEATWPEDITEASLEDVVTAPNEPPGTEAYTYRTARTLDPLDALRDEEEFMEKPHRNSVEEFNSLEQGWDMIQSKDEIKALKRKALPEEKLIKQPFYFGCCHNSTYVGCAGVCPETCEYRSKYCVPLCGPPCRCKHGFVYNIQRKGCTIRSDCPKGMIQSKKGVYRVFL